MKPERHISITLCDASNDFQQDLLLSIVRPFSPSKPQRPRSLGADQKERGLWGREFIPGYEVLYSACSSGGGGDSVWQMGEYAFF